MAAARELAGQRVCFVGVGLPNIAVNLAQRTVAPDCSWSTSRASSARGRHGCRCPSATRPSSRGATAVDQHAGAVRLLPAARPHRRRASWAPRRSTGSATSTPRSSATTRHPTTRLPGSGGACEIAINARQVFVIMRQSKRSFVERIDFRTSPGNLGGAEDLRADPPRAGLDGQRPIGGGHRPGHLPLRRGRRDAPRLAAPRRDHRGGPRYDRLDPRRVPGPGRRRRRPRPRSCASSARSSTRPATTRADPPGPTRTILPRPGRTTGGASNPSRLGTICTWPPSMSPRPSTRPFFSHRQGPSQMNATHHP